MIFVTVVFFIQVDFVFKFILYSTVFEFIFVRVGFALAKSLVIRDWSKSVGEEIGLVEARRKELRLVEISGDASIKVRLTAHFRI